MNVWASLCEKMYVLSHWTETQQSFLNSLFNVLNMVIEMHDFLRGGHDEHDLWDHK